MITCGENSDLDGLACAYAYAELLNAKGISATFAIFGKPHPEAIFVLDHLNLKIKSGESVVNRFDEIRIVDCSGPQWLSKKIPLEKVVEIIDHRKVTNTTKFSNVKKIQIELIGSCATLIAEKSIANKIIPSEKSAILLYCAIISNTINFKNKITTERDRAAAKYLKDLYGISDEIIHKMFEYKSRLDGPIKDVFLKDLAFHDFAGKKVCTFQLEIIGVKDFVNKNLADIEKALKKINSENNFDYTFLTCVDIEEGHNTLVAADDETRKVIEESLGVKFSGSVAKYPEVIMRKEILPKIKEYLESL